MIARIILQMGEQAISLKELAQKLADWPRPVNTLLNAALLGGLLLRSAALFFTDLQQTPLFA